jgi:hypothetical protein
VWRPELEWLHDVCFGLDLQGPERVLLSVPVSPEDVRGGTGVMTISRGCRSQAFELS